MHFARPVPPRITRTRTRSGSSWSPPVTSWAAALATARVAEPASKSAAKRNPAVLSTSPRPRPGAFYFVPQCGAIGSRNNACGHSVSGGQPNHDENLVVLLVAALHGGHGCPRIHRKTLGL